MVREMSQPTATTMTRTTGSCRGAWITRSTKAPTAVMGTFTAMRMSEAEKFVTTVTSLVSRVTIEAGRRRSMFSNDRSCTLRYMSLRSSAPMA